LPRTSSGTSGFFFCGMIELPVQKRSGKLIKLNYALVHNTSSSLMRERCVMVSAARAQNSMAKSRSLTASREFSQMPAKPNSSAVRSEEHTSELQSRFDLVCRLLLEKTKTNIKCE